MDKQHDQQAERRDNIVESRLEEIARGTSPPPARLPEQEPAHIPATTSDSNVTASLVLGIICLCISPILPWIAFPGALIGLIIGLVANNHNDGSAKVGVILNAVALGFSIIAVLIYLLHLLHFVLK